MEQTALDIACKYIEELDCEDCPLCGSSGCFNNHGPCDYAIKQHFQEQANIPNGWDVVKEILRKVQDAREISTTTQPKARAKASYWAYEYVEREIKKKLKEAGIEVE